MAKFADQCHDICENQWLGRHTADKAFLTGPRKLRATREAKPRVASVQLSAIEADHRHESCRRRPSPKIRAW